jgi:GT2 family glycosyltransferase
MNQTSSQRLFHLIHEYLQKDREKPVQLNRFLPQRCNLRVVGHGATTCHWSVHAWLQRCPLPNDFTLEERDDVPFVGLHLQSLKRTHETGELEVLRSCSIVLDPDLERVIELRGKGLRAYWIDKHAPVNHWLQKHFDAAEAAARLGLPDPETLAELGAVLCLGSPGPKWDRQLAEPLWGLPRFDQLHITDAVMARQLAGWLNATQRAGLQLVRLEASEYEHNCLPFQALERPTKALLSSKQQQWCEALLINGPIDTQALERELQWHWQGCPPPPAISSTPKPAVIELWSNSNEQPTAAVCISLHNYADRIERALESVREQTHQALELIVVDDSSSDGGEDVAQQWLAVHHERFARTLLLRHCQNSGLAAARNSAFAAAKAPWCFVLDADNTLEPKAVEHCLAVAERSNKRTAVVHPLVEVLQNGKPTDPALIGGLSWQQQALMHGNQIDAMALIRRAHWEQVGGYSHIPAGWEDYDFWCKLIGAGFHGILCPQRLAIYNRHDDSMQATLTQSHVRELQRLMQARHPWLAQERQWS